MCFSVQADVVAGALVLPMAVVSLRENDARHPSLLALTGAPGA